MLRNQKAERKPTQMWGGQERLHTDSNLRSSLREHYPWYPIPPHHQQWYPVSLYEKIHQVLQWLLNEFLTFKTLMFSPPLMQTSSLPTNHHAKTALVYQIWPMLYLWFLRNLPGCMRLKRYPQSVLILFLPPVQCSFVFLQVNDSCEGIEVMLFLWFTGVTMYLLSEENNGCKNLKVIQLLKEWTLDRTFWMLQ